MWYKRSFPILRIFSAPKALRYDFTCATNSLHVPAAVDAEEWGRTDPEELEINCLSYKMFVFLFDIRGNKTS